MGITLALIAAFFAFSWRITLRSKMKSSKSDLAFTALVDLFAGVTIALFIPFFGFEIPSTTELLGLFIISAVLSAIGDYLSIYAIRNADTADTSILMPLSNIWILLMAFLIFKEPLTTNKIIGISFIVIGSIITLNKGRKFTVNKGILAAFLYGWLITGTILIDKGISNNFSLPVYGTLFYLMCSSFLMIISGKTVTEKMITEWKINGWWCFALGAQWGLFTLTLLFAYAHAEASRAIPIMRVFIVLVTIYSIFVLNEKDRLRQKIIGSVLVTAGAFVLAYLK